MWSKSCEKIFHDLTLRLTSVTLLTLPKGMDGFVIYCDASRIGLGFVLMQNGNLLTTPQRSLMSTRRIILLTTLS